MEATHSHDLLLIGTDMLVGRFSFTQRCREVHVGGNGEKRDTGLHQGKRFSAKLVCWLLFALVEGRCSLVGSELEKARY